MKPINEIWLRLNTIFILILLPLFNPSGIINTLLIVLCGLFLGCYITNFLIVLKSGGMNKNKVTTKEVKL